MLRTISGKFTDLFGPNGQRYLYLFGLLTAWPITVFHNRLNSSTRHLKLQETKHFEFFTSRQHFSDFEWNRDLKIGDQEIRVWFDFDSCVYAGSGLEGMESVVATVSGYHGSERFNLIKLITQTGANYVGTMSKSTTHLVCWRFEGKKYNLAKKFKTITVSHKWFEECAKAGKRVPEGPFVMKCGEEVGPVQFDGLLMQKENLPPATQSNILTDDGNGRYSYENSPPNNFCDCHLWKTASSHSCLLELDTSPVKSVRLRSSELNRKKSKEMQLSSKTNSKEPHSSALVGDKGHGISPPYCQQSRRRKRDTSHNSCIRNSAETSTRGRRLVKKSVTRRILESDSDQDCYVVGTSGHQRGAVSTSGDLDEGTEEHINLSASLSPQKVSLSSDSATDEIDCKDTLHGEINDTSQCNQTIRQPSSSEPSCAICWTDFSVTRGILPCGHRYCFDCIQNWSDQLVSKKMVSTCPLCKEKFYNILKVDEAAASDQKMYSQSIPCAPLMESVSILPDHRSSSSMTRFHSTQACLVCQSREPIEFLESCNVCHNQSVHLYCLDPPLLPWVCLHCRDPRNVYQRSW